MRHVFPALPLIVATLLLGGAPGTSAAAEDFSPPAVPLVACDPYFSVWSSGAELTGEDTIHWTGRPHPLGALVKIDGKPFRVMGAQPQRVPALEQTGLEVTPTQSIYAFEGAGIELEVKFTTPSLPEDIDLLSRPITYVTFTAKATDGKEHDVQLYFDASALLTVNEPEQEATAVVDPKETQVDGLAIARMSSVEQNVLRKRGDDLRIDWGHFYLAAPEEGAKVVCGRASEMRRSFCEGDLDGATEADAAPAGRIGAAVALNVGKVGNEPVERHLIVAYDDLYSIEFMHKKLRPYWRRNGMEADGLLREAARDYAALLERCDAFDQELMSDLNDAGGADFAQICALAYRQCLAAGKFVADDNGQPIQFCKENHSNGCIGTSDVFYPMAPQFLLFGPSLGKSFIAPFMEYAASDRWKFPFAPHDLGTYPKANGQVYGGGERTEENQMPVEESGNMLLLMGAISQMEGNTDFADRYWPLLTQWAEYLRKEGYDPPNQLCTDDFAGHLAHNVNLSAKAICGLGAYAKMCEMRGDDTTAQEYFKLARGFAERWMAEADAGDHYRLTFDRPDTWSQKYNLVWDRVLGLGLFPDSVAEKEMAYYREQQNRYGLPLDNRSEYTKLDWILWSACLTENREDFEALVAPVMQFVNETPDRLPMTDWYFTDSGKKRGFTARPVVGGVFMRMLYDADAWQKWAARDQTGAGDYAPMPKPPKVTQVLPTAASKPAEWRYTTQEPQGDWSAADYNDSDWREGKSGFGQRGTPNATIGVNWGSNNIWVRRKFDVDMSKAKDLQLFIHHDEDAEVYVNGVLAAKLRGYTTDYEAVPLSDDARAALRAEGNTLAVHCMNRTGGQYIDVGLATVEQE